MSDIGIAVLGVLYYLILFSLSGTQVTQAGVDKLQQLLPDTYIDFESQEFGSGQGRPGGLSGRPQQSRDTGEGEGESRKSPFDAFTSLFSGGSDKDATMEEEVSEEEEEEKEKAGGTLGAIFRSLNPID